MKSRYLVWASRVEYPKSCFWIRSEAVVEWFHRCPFAYMCPPTPHFGLHLGLIWAVTVELRQTAPNSCYRLSHDLFSMKNTFKLQHWQHYECEICKMWNLAAGFFGFSFFLFALVAIKILSWQRCKYSVKFSERWINETDSGLTGGETF